MKKEHIFLIFALFLTLLLFYLLYQILSPFLEPILWAILMAMVLYPAYKKLHRVLKKRETLAAMLMTFLVVLVIILPLSLLLLSLTNEMTVAYHLVQEKVKSGDLQASWEKMMQNSTVEWILMKLGQKTDLANLDPFDFLVKNLQRISNFLFSQSTKILIGLSGFVIGFFFTLLSLYYLFKDGNHLFLRLKGTIPIAPKQRDLLIERFGDMVRATIYGGLLIALVQGLIGGIAFWILGLHSPVLWGTAMAFFSFIPVGGTALIWAPASIILFIKGEVVRGVILIIIGVFGIAMVDNLLRPYFISSRTKIHPLLLFFAVLGGIQAFGLVGLVVGPLVATLCLTLIEIYAEGTQMETSTEGAQQ